MTKDMTTGSPLRIILLFSIPVLLGNLFQQFYNMVDTIIVGRYLGEEALAAVGSTGCLMFLVLGFANGIAQGFGVMVSHAFGAKDFKLLRHYVALSLILTLIISLLLTIPTVTASRLLLAWMHTPENIIAMADAYIKVIFAGILLTMAYNVLSGILRGQRRLSKILPVCRRAVHMPDVRRSADSILRRGLLHRARPQDTRS